jgi:DMSO reductase family type II enzyme heme b subunit
MIDPKADRAEGAVEAVIGVGRSCPVGRSTLNASRASAGSVLSVLTALSASTALTPASVVSAQEPQLSESARRGKVVYDKWCMECHGETGAGDGAAAAFMLPRPRDFTRAVYQIRTTASGELPTDADIRQVIDNGMPGTAMPAWGTKLSEAERKDLVAYLKSFSTFFEGDPPTSIEVGREPRRSADGLAEGRATFETLECFKCHGDMGRGDGPSAPTLRDDWDFPTRAADLTQSWTFNGGSTVEEIYRRLRTGLDGTPMPSFSDVIDAQVITDEQLWRVAQYVRSLSPETPPQARDVLRARLVDGALPAGPADSAWEAVEPYYIPLVGQVVQKPRWFAPMVEMLWAQAVHDGRTLAVRVAWHDRSRSPDPAWDEWLAAMVAAVTDVDGPLGTAQGPDRLTIQFPGRLSGDLERPYFLGGDRRRPVYLWRWSSEPDGVEEGTGTGFGRFTLRDGGGQVTHQARFDRGEWQVQFTRPLVSSDSTQAPSFTPGEVIPLAFFAADGSSGETDGRGSISAWYGIYLDVPTPRSVFLIPVVAAVLTAGLGMMVVWRAQRRGLGRSTSEES